MKRYRVLTDFDGDLPVGTELDAEVSDHGSECEYYPKCLGIFDGGYCVAKLLSAVDIEEVIPAK